MCKPLNAANMNRQLREVVRRRIDGAWLSLLGSGIWSQLGLGAESQSGLSCIVTIFGRGC